jgi:hypothetical protein
LTEKDENKVEIKLWCKKEDDHTAKCSLCFKTFSISNGGITQIKQHSKGVGHKKISDVRFGGVQATLGPALAPAVEKLTDPKRTDTTTPTPSTSAAPSTSADQPRVSQPMINMTLQPTLMTQVREAEILWALYMSKKDIPFAACDNIGSLFSRMFPCPVADHFSMASTKASYIVSDGLGPYVGNDTASEIIKEKTGYTLLYDETTTTQNVKQMDLLVRYWSTSDGRVQRKFLEAFHFGHAKGQSVAAEILGTLEKHSLPLDRLISLSSDGPNVNKTIWTTGYAA